MKANIIGGKIKGLLQDAAKKLTGVKRRSFIAKVVIELYDRNARKAEQELGWGRETIQKGINELSSNIVCVDNYKGRGNKKTEEKIPTLERDIREIVEPHCQVDPKFQSNLVYTRITPKAVRQALLDEKEYKDEELPTERTILNILNRLGYSLKRVEKTKPLKKIKEVDEIFDNVHKVKSESENDPETINLSIDTKAEVKVGELSRGGKCRDKEAPKALDHDTTYNAKLKPFGILDRTRDFLTIIFGNSAETSDFIVDALLDWWETNKHFYPHKKKLVINLDNGPQVKSTRTQFIKRMVEFADTTGLRIHLVYYPPYHSKYNPIERCWGILEKHWNGTILDSIEKTLKWAKTMTWKGVCPAVKLLDKAYKKGISLTKKEMEKYNQRLNRSKNLPKWDVCIEPQFG